MKLKRTVRSLVISGLLVATIGSQASAYQKMGSWSGYLGSNKWTAVSYYITENDSDKLSHVQWSTSGNKAKGCIVALYNENGMRVKTEDLSDYYNELITIKYTCTKNLQYKLYAKLKTYNKTGVKNTGKWEP